MPLLKEQRIIENLKSNPNIKAIRIRTTTQNFVTKFKGSTSLFFRTLKNGLNSYSSVSNREYFRNLSGCYFTLESSEQLEMIILYDASVSNLNPLQVKTRIKRMLGLEIEIELGNFETYALRIQQMVSTARKTQTFGDLYFKKKKV